MQKELNTLELLEVQKINTQEKEYQRVPLHAMLDPKKKDLCHEAHFITRKHEINASYLKFYLSAV